MTVLSPRYALAAIALLVATALPVWFHALVAPTYEDCANPAAFFRAPQIGGADVGALGHPLLRFEGAEGRWLSSRRALSVRAVRSFDPSPLYWRPILFGFDTQLYLQEGEVRWVEAADDVLPVHWSSDRAQSLVRIEAYVFVQGGAPVEHPARSGLALAWPQLVHGTRPITLLVVSGASPHEELPALRLAAERWLVAAWQELEVACRF